MKQFLTSGWIFVFLFWFAWCFPAFAQKTPDGIVVWELEKKSGVSREDIDSITGIVTAKVEEFSGRKVISNADILTVLKGEETRQKCGAEGSDSCMAEIGAALGVPEAVSGDLGHVGEIWVLNLRRVNLRSVGVLKRASRQVEGDLTDLVRVVPCVVGELFGVKVPEPPPRVKKEEPKKKPDVLKITGYSLVGGGAAFLVLGGIATWQMDDANQKNKSKFDTWKNTSIAGYSIGAAAVATGAGLLIYDALQKDKNPKNPKVSVIPLPGGASACIGWRW